VLCIADVFASTIMMMLIGHLFLPFQVFIIGYVYVIYQMLCLDLSKFQGVA